MTQAQCLVSKTLLISFIFAATYAVNTDNLVAVVQLFRHGERAPKTIYQNDPYKAQWENIQTSQLTNEGRRQLFALGQYTRDRYRDWIPVQYRPDVIYARTTDLDRTHMSGLAYLYGLFPAKGDQKWHPKADWQPIPLHIADSKILWSAHTKCPSYYHVYDKVLLTDVFKKLHEKYKDVYAFIAKHTGENITDLHTAKAIFDNLRIANATGLPLPKWSKNVYPQPLEMLAGFRFKSLTFTNQLKRFFCGPLLNELLEYFEQMSRNSSYAPKIQILSGHQSNIASLLNVFEEYEDPYPPEFASTIWMELRKKNNIPYVEFWCKNGNDLNPLSVRGCAYECPLTEFRSRLNDFLINIRTWTMECYCDPSVFMKDEFLKSSELLKKAPIHGF